MTSSSKFGTRSFLNVGYIPQSESASRLLSYPVNPTPVSGPYITFPDGTKFRRATNYKKSDARLEPKRDMAINGHYEGGPSFLKGKRIDAKTFPGGYLLQSPLTLMKSDLKSGGFESSNLAPIIPTGMRNEVITKSLLDFADQKVNLGENLATLQQTLRLMTDPGGSFVRLVLELRKTANSKVWKHFLHLSARSLKRKGPLSRAAENYLKYVYGLRPLMQDTYGLIELAKQQGGSPLLLHASRQTTEKTQTGVKNRTSSVFDYSYGPLDVSTRVKASLWAQIDPNYSGTRALNQLGLLNPASLAWELVPFSFVVDWVLPIGPVLQALTAPAGLKFVDGSISSRVSAVGPFDSIWNYPTKSEPWRQYLVVDNMVPSSDLFQYEGYRRDAITSWPQPGLWIDRDPLRGDRPLKALALSVLALARLR